MRLDWFDPGVWSSLRRQRILINLLNLYFAMGSVGPVRAQEERVVWELSGGGWLGGVRELPSGTLLITEKVRNRVVEILPSRPNGGTAVWVYQGFAWPDYARRLPNGNTLIADTNHHQVIEVGPDGRVVSAVGDGGTACLDGQLRQPSDALVAESGNFVVVDQGHARLLEFTRTGVKVWEYGPQGCTPASPMPELVQPYHLEVLRGGDVLVVDPGRHMVSRVSPTRPRGGTVRWEYGVAGIAGADAGLLNLPVRARVLDGGNVLIADALNHRVLEIEPTAPRGGRIVWQYGVTGYPGSGAGYLDTPYDAERRANGNTLIAEKGNGRVIEIAPLSLELTAPAAPVDFESCAGPFGVHIVDTYGGKQAAATTVITLLQSSRAGLTFSPNSTCAELVSFVAIPPGVSAAAFYVRASVAGGHSVSATAAGYGQGRLDFDVAEAPVVPPPPAKHRVGCDCSEAGLPALWICCVVATAWKRRHAC